MNVTARTSGVCVSIVCVAIAIALLVMGCGSETCTEVGGSGSVKVTVSVGGWATSAYDLIASGPVDFEDIQSFLLTLERITMHVSAEDDSVEGVVVFDASEQSVVDNEIDLVDFSALSEIVFSAPVPAGDYEQIRMEISNPRLQLVGDAAEEYRTNVQLTANGRLFAEVDLTIQAGETLALDLILNDLHLVEKGNGDFVLTPQLRVEIPSGD